LTAQAALTTATNRRLMNTDRNFDPRSTEFWRGERFLRPTLSRIDAP
jgi:hypothetical protein